MDETTVLQLSQNPIIILGSIAIGLLGIILAIIFHYKGKKEKRPVYTVHANTLIEKANACIKGLEISYDSVKQDRITVTKIGFWNAGKEPIRTEDIASASPIEIVVAPGAEVLSAQCDYSVEESCRFSIEKTVKGKESSEKEDKTIIPIVFEYLDKSQGGIIRLVHTGDEKHDIIVRGKVIGAKPIEKLETVVQSMSRFNLRTQALTQKPYRFGLLQVGIMVGLSLLGLILMLSGSLVVGVPFFVIGSLGAIVFWREAFSAKMPKPLLEKL